MTFGSRSSPAIAIAGSPGRSCCSPKIRIETKNSVGTIAASRFARNWSTRPSAGLLAELHVLQAHERKVAMLEPRGLGEELLALGSVIGGARFGDELVEFRIGVAGIVERLL